MVPEELFNKYEEVFFSMIYFDKRKQDDLESFGFKKTEFIIQLRDLFDQKPNATNLTAFFNHPAIQYLWCNKQEEHLTLKGFVHSELAQHKATILPSKVAEKLNQTFSDLGDKIEMHEDFEKYVSFRDIKILALWWSLNTYTLRHLISNLQFITLNFSLITFSWLQMPACY